MASVIHTIPDAWPLFLTKEQLCAYLGGMDYRTITHICPVAPLDFGNRIVRYHRLQIDAWAAALPQRLPKRVGEDNNPDPQDEPEPDFSAAPRETPADRARRRAQEAKKWPKAS